MARLFLIMCNHEGKIILYVMGLLVAVVVFAQFQAVPSAKYLSILPPREEASPLRMLRKRPPSWNLVNPTSVVKVVGDNGLIKVYHVDSGEDLSSMKESGFVKNGVAQLTTLPNTMMENIKNHDTEFSTKFASRSSSQEHLKPTYNKNDSFVIESYVRKMRGATTTLADMKTMLLHQPALPTLLKQRGSTARDRLLLSASLQINNAPVLKCISDLHPPLFRNVSVFKRSYDLMERLLKIYVYKEGEKPVFHHPRLRGLYAAEGWFMKLLVSSKHFTVRDPSKAHLYYLPFSVEALRTNVYTGKSNIMKNMEQYIVDYLDLIKSRYPFWNRSGGADHFFVACHDWGLRITRHPLNSSIRGLCNANVARGFSIGKDVSVPVTYIRSRYDPTGIIGGKPPSKRNILAFFAGQSHGYIRPLLLQHWENKFPDMKIMGPMQRDVQGKAVYKEYMKSIKYCICARGYEVHTPRVVESIFNECIPVIFSDNYVPPFFEVLDWEAFAVFVQEKDILNLRNILQSIPEEKYLGMHQRLKIVRKHFIWHETPEKYDLFHMILHSIWYNRIARVRVA